MGVCIVYPERRQFSLAHILLPNSPGPLESTDPQSARFADTVVPHLLELMQLEKVERRKLRAYVAGGSGMYDGGSQRSTVGQDNRDTLVESLKKHRVRIAEEDTGGDKGRQLVVHGPRGIVVSLHIEDPQASLVWEFPANYRIAGKQKP